MRPAVNFGDERLGVRFWNKVQPCPMSGCWLWTANTGGHYGYGRLTYNKRPYASHRFAYEALVGPIPDGLQLDHLCRVTCCVNPAHLEPVTAAENVRRLAESLRPSCPTCGSQYRRLSEKNNRRVCDTCRHGYALSRQDRMRASGLCKYAASHGPAVTGLRVCQPCRDRQHVLYENRKRRKAA